MTTVTHFRPNDSIVWNAGEKKPRRGVVESIENQERSLRIDKIMEREPGASLREFGRLCLIVCEIETCHCHASSWRHGCNEIQLTASNPLAEGMLW